MTPTAVTPAARATRQSPPRQSPAERQPAAPRSPRRISGPARPSRTARPGAAREAATPRAAAPRAATARPATPRAATARAAAARPATGRPATRLSAPRRVSGPARRVRTSPEADRPGLGVRSLRFLRALPDHSLLDRIVRGRVWIPLLGILLTGIVAMQVEVLKLNSGIGHSTVSTTQLQSENQFLRANVARLADDQRIEALAARMGMVMPQPSSVNFLPANGSAEVGRAVTSIHQPDAAGFAARLQAAATTAANAAAAAGSTSATGAGATAAAAPTTSPNG